MCGTVVVGIERTHGGPNLGNAESNVLPWKACALGNTRCQNRVLSCFHAVRRVGSRTKAIVKGTLAARRGRKVTALERQRSRGLGHRRDVVDRVGANGADRRYLVGRAAAWTCFGRHIRHASRTAHASSDPRIPAGGDMPKRPLMTMLSTAAMTVLAAMSIPVTSVVAAPAARRGESRGEKQVHQQHLHRTACRKAGDGLCGRHQGTSGHQAAQGSEDRPQQPGGRQLSELPRITAGSGSRQRRRGQEELPRLWLRVQRLRR